MFSKAAIPGSKQLQRYGISLLAIIAVTAIDFLQKIFGTTGLSLNQWLICIGLAASLIIVEEVIKLIIRIRLRGSGDTTSQETMPVRATVAA